jgi:DNA repair protein RadC
MAEKNPNAHAGHRERMRVKFKKDGGDSMPDHELVEMLLFYIIPRSNTNNIAHALLDRFGSIEGIVNARPEHLSQIDGIGENAALFLTMCGAILRRIARGTIRPKKKYTSLEDIADYLHRMFIGMSQECVYLMMFDNGMHLIDTVELARGEVNHVSIDPHRLMKEAMLHNASAVLLAHNHPDGEARPSEADLDTTDRVQYLLSSTNITLVDHLIFSGGSYTSIVHPPVREMLEIEDDFYTAYYKRYCGENSFAE